MRRILLASAALLFSAGCVPRYAVIHQASPNPLAGKTNFNVAPPDFSKTTVNDKPVVQWVSEGGADEAKDWPLNTANATKEFNDQLAGDKGNLKIATTGSAAPGEFLVVPTVESIDPGVYAVAWSSPTQVSVRMKVYDNGQQTDEIVMHESVQSDLMHPSFNQRLADCMQNAADDAVDYLQKRSSGK